MFKNSSTTYYQKNKEKLQKNLMKSIKIFLKKSETKNNAKNIKKLSEDEKQELVEYRRECCRKWKNKTASEIKTDLYLLAKH